MAESAFSKLKDDVAKNPATDRLKEELQNYLQARAQHAVIEPRPQAGRERQQARGPGQGGRRSR